MPGLSDFLQGAGGGAMAGGAMGGPWGALAGGVGGGILSLFGNDDDALKSRLDDYYKQIQNRQAPQMGPAAQSGFSDFRGNQTDLVKRLEALSKGQGPSLAMEQLKASTDRNMAQQASIAQSGRGNPGAAAMMAANASAGLGQQATQTGVQARIAEQQMALQQLGGAINQGRNSDEANTQFNAQQTNYNMEANLKAKLQAMGYNDQAIANILQQMGGANARPTMGEQLLAGGSSALAMKQSQQGKNRV
jgi:hypothetical protein